MATSSETVKGTIHTNLELEGVGYSRHHALEFAKWLNGLTRSPVSDVDIAAHLDALDKRIEGELSIAKTVAATKTPLALLRYPAMLLKHWRLAVFRLGPIDVSFDVFNPNGELGVTIRGDRMVLELFLVEAHEKGQGGRALASLCEKAVAAHPVPYAFGGDTAFLATLIAACKRQAAEPDPDRYLWPITYWLESPAPADVTSSMPVYRVTRPDRGGLFVQVFEDLTNGYEDKYAAAALALQRRTIWELIEPEARNPRR